MAGTGWHEPLRTQPSGGPFSSAVLPTLNLMTSVSIEVSVSGTGLLCSSLQTAFNTVI